VRPCDEEDYDKKDDIQDIFAGNLSTNLKTRLVTTMMASNGSAQVSRKNTPSTTKVFITVPAHQAAGP
jgi:hypothetical protein